VYFTAAQGVWSSFFTANNVNLSVFCGLDNYRRMLNDTYFWQSFRNALKWAVLSVTAGWIMPFAAAELLTSLSSLRWQFVFRTLLLLPMAFPVAVIAFTWQAMYTADPSNEGAVNVLLRNLGLGGLMHDWLGDPKTALYALLFMGFPYIAGLAFLLLLAGLQNISPEVLEAAALDGCGRWRRVIAVDLPLLGSQFRLLAMLALLQWPLYGAITLLMSTSGMALGGPFFATNVPVVWLINSGINAGDFGYGSAMGVALFAVGVAGSLLFVGSLRLAGRLSLSGVK
jgi:ABC-type sugar transport system permease subunit